MDYKKELEKTKEQNNLYFLAHLKVSQKLEV